MTPHARETIGSAHHRPGWPGGYGDSSTLIRLLWCCWCGLVASITFKLEGLSSLQKALQVVDPANFAKWSAEGVRYASKSVPPTVAKGIAADYAIKSARIKQDIKPPRIASDGSSATIAFSRRPPTLMQFSPKPGKRGPQPGLGRGLGWGRAQPAGKPLTALVLRSAGRQPYRGAFVATTPSGNTIVAKRDGHGGIKAIYGPSIGSIFLGHSKISEQLQADVKARIQEQFITGFNRAMERSARGY